MKRGEFKRADLPDSVTREEQREGVEVCDAARRGTSGKTCLCTVEAGHDGPHVAHAGDSVVAVWSQDPDDTQGWLQVEDGEWWSTTLVPVDKTVEAAGGAT